MPTQCPCSTPVQRAAAVQRPVQRAATVQRPCAALVQRRNIAAAATRPTAARSGSPCGTGDGAQPHVGSARPTRGAVPRGRQGQRRRAVVYGAADVAVARRGSPAAPTAPTEPPSPPRRQSSHPQRDRRWRWRRKSRRPVPLADGAADVAVARRGSPAAPTAPAAPAPLAASPDGSPRAGPFVASVSGAAGSSRAAPPCSTRAASQHRAAPASGAADVAVAHGGSPAAPTAPARRPVRGAWTREHRIRRRPHRPPARAGGAPTGGPAAAWAAVRDQTCAKAGGTSGPVGELSRTPRCQPSRQQNTAPIATSGPVGVVAICVPGYPVRAVQRGVQGQPPHRNAVPPVLGKENSQTRYTVPALPHDGTAAFRRTVVCPLSPLQQSMRWAPFSRGQRCVIMHRRRANVGNTDRPQKGVHDMDVSRWFSPTPTDKVSGRPQTLFTI